MSAHYGYYSKIDGHSAFLSGNVSAFADAFLCGILPKYWALEADVFEADTSNLCERIRARLRDYLLDDSDDAICNIDTLDFDLQPMSSDLPKIFHDLLDRYKEQHVQDEVDKINQFVSEIRYQLGDIKGIYSISGTLNESITDALSKFYTYIVFEVLFIEYDGYLVMLVFGSDE